MSTKSTVRVSILICASTISLWATFARAQTTITQTQPASVICQQTTGSTSVACRAEFQLNVPTGVTLSGTSSSTTITPVSLSSSTLPNSNCTIAVSYGNKTGVTSVNVSRNAAVALKATCQGTGYASNTYVFAVGGVAEPTQAGDQLNINVLAGNGTVVSATVKACDAQNTTSCTAESAPVSIQLATCTANPSAADAQGTITLNKSCNLDVQSPNFQWTKNSVSMSPSNPSTDALTAGTTALYAVRACDGNNACTEYSPSVSRTYTGQQSSVSWAACKSGRTTPTATYTLPTNTGTWGYGGTPGVELVLQIEIPNNLVSTVPVTFSWNNSGYEQNSRWITISRTPCAVPANVFGVQVTGGPAWTLANSGTGGTSMFIAAQEGAGNSVPPVLAPGTWYLTQRPVPTSYSSGRCVACGVSMNFTGLAVTP